MKQIATFMFMCMSLYAGAQTHKGDNDFPRIIMSNGTVVSPKYCKATKALKVEVQENNDEVEILAVSNGHVVDSETSIFDDDNIQLDLSSKSNQPLDIYVRTRKEVQYMGTVETKE